MKSFFRQDMIVQDVVKDHHYEARVFRRLGIDPDDTCTLAEVALKMGLSIEFLMTILDKTKAMTKVIEQSADHSFQAMFMDVIIEYIEEYHHVFLKNELSRLEQLLDKVIKANCHNHGSMLEKLKMVFLPFKTNIEKHVAIEEEILFPQLRNIEWHAAGKELLVEPSGKSSPICAVQEMQREHELMECAWNEMKALTSDFITPDEASDDLVLLYEKFVSVEADLQEHAHLENELLWPVRLSEQTPEDVAIVTDKNAPARQEEIFICPINNQPCKDGSPARCSRFWDCISEVMQQRWVKMNGKDNDD